MRESRPGSKKIFQNPLTTARLFDNIIEDQDNPHRKESSMTKEKFIRIQRKRGYQVEELGNIISLTMDNYHAMWFFLPDGSEDPDKPPVWHLDRPKK